VLNRAAAALLAVLALASCGSDAKPSRSADGRLPLGRSAVAALSDDDLQECVWSAIDERVLDDSLDRERQNLETLPAVLQDFWRILEVDYEIQNGGMNQLFFNTTTAWVDDALPAYRRAGLAEHAALLREAIRIADRPEERALREAAQQDGSDEAFSASYQHTALNPLDDRYAALGEAGAGANRLLRDHLDEAIAPGPGRCPA
jgi:hypothetical protein